MILNEKKYAEMLLLTSRIKKQREFVDLLILGKYFIYLYGKNEYSINDIENKLVLFANNAWKYQVETIRDNTIKKVIEIVKDIDLYMSEDIFITNDEINHIKKITEVDLQNIMFSILVLCKVQKNMNINFIKKCKSEIIELKNNKETKANLKKIEVLENKIEKRNINNDNFILIDKSRHQINTFMHCNFNKKYTVVQKQYLCADLIDMGYININTIKGNSKLISIVKFDNDVNDIAFRITCNPIESNEYDFYNFQYLWNEVVLKEPVIKCRKCEEKIQLKANNQVYCKSCGGYEKMETKAIKCIDCGVDVVVDSLDRKPDRCNKCYGIYRKIQVNENVKKSDSYNDYEKMETKVIKCIDCKKDVVVDSLDRKTDRCNKCYNKHRKIQVNKNVKKSDSYSLMETKVVKCIDCKKDVVVDSLDRKTDRCNECYGIYRREKNKEKYKRYNDKRKNKIII